MRTKYLLIVSLFFHFAMGQQRAVNTILKDSSWYYTNPNIPLSEASEKDRIKTHLSFVIDRLRANSAKVPPGLKQQRSICISLLEEYVKQGQFPHNSNYPNERKPCFIDNEKNICAVGYLLEKTAGRQEAERINSLFQYEYIKDMNDQGLLAWQQSSGLSIRELEMIQPTYRMPVAPTFYVYYNQHTKKYGIKDPNGKKLVRAKFDSIIFNRGRAIGNAKINGHWGLISSQGKLLTKLEYDKPLQETQSGAINYFLGNKSGNLYLLSYSGEVLQTFKNASFDNLIGNFFIIKQNDKLGLWHREGYWKVEPSFLKVQYHSDERLYALIRYDHQPNVYAEVNPNITPGRARGFVVQNETGYGLLDMNGELIIPIEYESIEWKPQAWYALKHQNEGYLFNPEGRLSTVGKVERLIQYNRNSDRLLIMAVQNGKFGLISLTHQNWIISPKYDYIEEYLGYHRVRLNGLYGFFTKDGTPFLPPEIQYFSPYMQYILIRKNGKMGWMDLNKNYVISCKQDSIKVVKSNFQDSIFLLAIKNKEKWSFSLGNGKKIKDLKVDSVGYYGKALVFKDDGFYYFGQWRTNSIDIKKNLPLQAVSWGGDYKFIYKYQDKFGLWSYKEDDWINTGQFIEPFYDEMTYMRLVNYQLYIVKKDAKISILDKTGQTVIASGFLKFKTTKQGFTNYLYLKNDEGWFEFTSGGKLRKQSLRYSKILEEGK